VFVAQGWISAELPFKLCTIEFAARSSELCSPRSSASKSLEIWQSPLSSVFSSFFVSLSEAGVMHSPAPEPFFSAFDRHR
jgi:hypothetical protein